MPLAAADGTKMVRVAVAAVLVVGCVHHLPATAAGQPSVFYVNSVSLGNYLEKPGMTIDSKDAYLTISAKDKCSCRAACRTHPRCVAAAIVPDGQAWQCRLADEGPIFINVTEDPEATYVFWEKSLPENLYFGLGKDRMLYLVEKFRNKTFQEAKNFCRRIPGHRLAMTKTRNSFDALVDIIKETGHAWVWIDLRQQDETDKNSLVWGDNTTYSVTNIMLIVLSRGCPFILTWWGIIRESCYDGRWIAACQADPLGLGD
ncbi:uncharacterized protein LOC127009262 isoform X2 [Eriocheir sinensis]|nr:uncharacterized protein LOC127009262 isoform X2 [Eriocheir sinensis]